MDSKIQGLAFAIVVLVGCFAVMKGEMTTGALVACSILSSRMLGPIAQISGVLGRLQQAKVAKTGLDELMKNQLINLLMHISFIDLYCPEIMS